MNGGVVLEPRATPDPATTTWVPIWNMGNPAPPGPVTTRITRSTVFSIPNSAWTVVPFDTVRYDANGMWASGQPTRLTCKVAGTYMVWGEIQFNGVSGGGYRLLRLMLNGTKELAADGYAGASLNAGTSQRSGTHTLVQLAVGDYIEMQTYQDSGSALNTIPVDPNGWSNAELAIALLGGPSTPAPGVSPLELLYAPYTASSPTVGATSGAANANYAARSFYFPATPAVTFDGLTAVLAELWVPFVYADSGFGFYMYFEELVGSTYTTLARWTWQGVGGNVYNGLGFRYRYTPTSGAKQYRISGVATAASGNTIFYAGVGGNNDHPPAFIRVTRAA